MNNNIVYILGAGCSANYGYPLAKDFCATLKGFSTTLDQRPNCERLKRCVTDTISLMEQFQSPTIDRLVLKIVEELKRQRLPLEFFATIELENLERDQILNAKRATEAVFLELEGNARKSGLQGYRDFFNIIFEGNRNPSALESTTSRVLSFNYDRLFEIAFADYFSLDSSSDCYGRNFMNSGFDFFRRKGAAVAPGRFCFLKLHGTAGMLVAEQYGEARYGWSAALHNSNLTVDDNLFWPAGRKQSFHPKENPEPLIVFPFEKDRARSGGTTFLFDNYIRAIWGEAEKPGHAEKLVQEAKQLRVIGYSFDPNDRKAMIELLRKTTDCEIIIRNKDMEAAASVCAELGLEYPDLTRRLKPFAKPF